MSHMSRDEYVAWTKSPECAEEIGALTLAEVTTRYESEFNTLNELRHAMARAEQTETVQRIDEALSTIDDIRRWSRRLVEMLAFQWDVTHCADLRTKENE